MVKIVTSVHQYSRNNSEKPNMTLLSNHGMIKQQYAPATMINSAPKLCNQNITHEIKVHAYTRQTRWPHVRHDDHTSDTMTFSARMHVLRYRHVSDTLTARQRPVDGPLFRYF